MAAQVRREQSDDTAQQGHLIWSALTRKQDKNITVIEVKIWSQIYLRLLYKANRFHSFKWEYLVRHASLAAFQSSCGKQWKRTLTHWQCHLVNHYRNWPNTEAVTWVCLDKKPQQNKHKKKKNDWCKMAASYQWQICQNLSETCGRLLKNCHRRFYNRLIKQHFIKGPHCVYFPNHIRGPDVSH